MITGVLFPNSSIYSITLRKDGNVTCWTFLSVFFFFNLYILYKCWTFFFYMFVVLPKFLLLAVHCQYRLSETCHDPVITGRLNYDLTIIHCLFVWDNHTSIVTGFLHVWQMLEVLSPMPRTWLLYLTCLLSLLFTHDDACFKVMKCNTSHPL